MLTADSSRRTVSTLQVARRPLLVAIRAFGVPNPSVEWAALRAASTDTPLVLVHAVPSALLMPATTTYSDVVAEGRLLLHLEAARLTRKLPTLRIGTYLHCGDVVHALVGLSVDAELLVVGADRMDTVTGVFRGSVAIEVALAAVSPVLVIPPGHHEDGSKNGSSRACVVVGVDGSDDALLALRRAAAEAGKIGAALRVVTAVRPEARLTEAQTESIGATLVRIRAQRPTIVVNWVLDEVRTPARALRRHSQDAALLVIARHGRGARPAMALGAVTHALLLDPLCPTLVTTSGSGPGTDSRSE